MATRTRDDRLTAEQAWRLVRLEDTVRDGLRGFAAAGAALRAIRDDRLYRAVGTFAEYLRARWGMSRAQAYRLIDAAAIVETLSPAGDVPVSERQCRLLKRLTADEMREVQAWVAGRDGGWRTVSPEELDEEVGRRERARERAVALADFDADVARHGPPHPWMQRPVSAEADRLEEAIRAAAHYAGTAAALHRPEFTGHALPELVAELEGERAEEVRRRLREAEDALAAVACALDRVDRSLRAA